MNKVYLIGLPGAGKSYVGKKLADWLQWEFIDLDERIESEKGKSIAELFEKGENNFREVESEVLKKTSTEYECVISCGGGTPAWNDNMDWMMKQGLTVYLNPEIDQIVPRISGNATERPMFNGLNEAQIRQKLSEIVENRGEFYSKSKLVWTRTEPNDKFYTTVNQLLSLYSARF